MDIVRIVGRFCLHRLVLLINVLLREKTMPNPAPAAEWVKTVPLDCPHVEARELYVCHACMAANLDAYARQQVEAALERAKEVLLSKPMGRQALWVAHDAVNVIAAAIRALVP